MIVSCSVCTQRYHLDDEVLGSRGQKVRCTYCGHIWHQNPVRSSVNMLVPVATSLVCLDKKFMRSSTSFRFFLGGIGLLALGVAAAVAVIFLDHLHKNPMVASILS